MSTQYQDRIAYLGALSLLFSFAELFIPRILPFFRLGLANIPLILGLTLDFRSYFLLILIKAIGNAYISGTLFSLFAILSIAQSAASGILMYALYHSSIKLSIYSISALGALISALTQISIASLYAGKGTLSFMPLMIALSLPSSILVAFISNRIAIPEKITLEESESKKGMNALSIIALIASAGAVLLESSIELLSVSLILAFIFQKRMGRKIKLLPHIGTLIFMLISSTLTPSGRILFSLFSFPITDGALLTGLRGALRLSSCMALSQGFSATIRPSSSLLSRTLSLFSTMQILFLNAEGTLRERIKAALQLEMHIKRQISQINISAFTLISILIIFPALLLLDFLFF